MQTSKTVNGVKHTYTLDGTKILREAWSGNTLIPLYDNEDSVCGIQFNGAPFYFQKNLQGDIIGIVDKDAQIVALYRYDAWGVPTITQDISDCSIATVNPFRYRGYYYDTESGLYYLQSRYYDPSVGRFINGDNTAFLNASGTILVCSLYAYCENDPVIYVDVSGERIARPMDIRARCTIFSIKQFYNESKRVERNLINTYYYFSSSIFTVTNYAGFVKKWNAMPEQDVVVINCHASPTSMNKGGMGITDLSKISSLKFKKIQALILLGCNAGHYDYIWKNVAYEFAKKISGCVMASDGTVYSIPWFTPNFLSSADSSWRYYRDKQKSRRKKHWGWVIYKNNICYCTGMTMISIPSAVKYLQKNNRLHFSNLYDDYKSPSYRVLK